MVKTRVLVVEDSPTVRARLVAILRSDPALEVVGEAADGRQGIELCERLRPDVITMDMMLPVMSGLAATEYIMARCPTPILVVSASTNRGELFKIYEALAAGAVDVLEKPIGTEPEGAWESRLLPTVKRVARIRVITHPRARLQTARRSSITAATTSPLRSGRCYSLVAIGASTGGPGAIVEILRGLPADFQLPIVVVLHINEPFGAGFADWLDGQTARRVTHPREGQPILLERGGVVVAPGGRHLVVREGRLHLTDDPERHCCRPSVDVLFQSVAREYGASAIACLFTGMGKDGARCLLDISRAGGVTIAQDESTSVVYGMPREAALIGAAQHILRIGEIAPALAALSGLSVGAPA
jgi:two-component system chemotaxis response regulator CheB